MKILVSDGKLHVCVSVYIYIDIPINLLAFFLFDISVEVSPWPF